MSQPSKKKITRSRSGCHRCKRLKVKCLEEKPACSNCVRAGEKCDYSLKLTWGGRPYKNAEKRQAGAAVAAHAPFVAQSINFVTPNSRRARPLAKPRPPYKSPATKLKEELELESLGGPRVKREPDDAVAPAPKRPSRDALDSLAFYEANQLSLGDGPRFLDGLLNPEPHGAFGGADEPFHGAGTRTSPASTAAAAAWERRIFDADIEDYDVDLAAIGDSFPPKPRSPYFTSLGYSPRTPEDSAGRTPELGGFDEYGGERAGATVRIPPSLTPLPELLLKVPYYRELLHFWVDVAAENLVCAPSSYKDNPFKIILPQMAMHYSGVLTTILAFAARARQVLGCGDNTQSNIVNQLLSRSCDELMRLLQDEAEATSDGTLATSLLLACYEVCHSNDFQVHRTHTHGASQILLARARHLSPAGDARGGSCSPRSQPLAALALNRESDITFFLVRWFTYVDVVGALSSTRDRDNYLRAYKTREGYHPVTSIDNFDAADSKDIDSLLGFDARLLPHFVNISLLVGEVEKCAGPAADASSLPVHLVTAALELRDNFRKAYEAAEARREVRLGEMLGQPAPSHARRQHLSAVMHHGNVLRSTNRLYFDMGLLNLYRRALLLPRSSPLVQNLVAEMTEVLEQCVEAGSAAELCTIFCNFCAACDTLDGAKRDFFVRRFSRLATAGNINAAKSLVIMNRCWDTGEDWITAANRLDIDLVLM